METICPSEFAITVIIRPSLIARDDPLVPLNPHRAGLSGDNKNIK